MAYNYIEECVNLGIEFIDGYLGKGTEYFNIEANLVINFLVNKLKINFFFFS